MAEWTPEEDADLFRMWNREGLSASICAKHFPGRTRNSIIGRVNRMGWNRPQASPPSLKLPYPKRAAPKHVRRRSLPAPAFVTPNWKDSGPVQPTRAELLNNPVESPNAKPWLERAFGECAFPVSGEGADTVSCCNPTVAMYCAPHVALMTNPSTFRKVYPSDLGASAPKPKERQSIFSSWLEVAA